MHLLSTTLTSDDEFVVNDLVPALEEDRDFKLFIHTRDFILGRDIIDNIEEAIEATIVPSLSCPRVLWTASGDKRSSHTVIWKI